MRFYRIPPSVVLLVLSILLLFSQCAHPQIKPAERFVTIFVSSGLTPRKLAKMATLIQETKKTAPVFWIEGDELSDTSRYGLLTDGESMVSLFSAAGCDACLLTPVWLELGINRLKLLLDRARFRVLSANLEDSFGLPVVHPWMIKRAENLTLGITALVLDSADWRLYQQGLRLIPPGYAARKTDGLISRNTDFRLLFLPPGGDSGIKGFDLILPVEPGRVMRYDLVFLDLRLGELRKKEIDLESWEPDPTVERRIDSLLREYEIQAQSPVVETRVKIFPRHLRRVVMDGVINHRLADVVIYDTIGLVHDTIPPGTITRRQLAWVFNEPGRWALVQLTGGEIRRLGTGPGLKIEARKNLPGNRLMAHKKYRTLLAPSLLKQHPHLYTQGYELTPLPFYQYAADILQAQGKR